ncbi:hypothetical protein [Neobacillus mesonae]|nr:hypothetical protein [Neobacillus mesonae]
MKTKTAVAEVRNGLHKLDKTKTVMVQSRNGLHKQDEDQNSRVAVTKWSS